MAVLLDWEGPDPTLQQTEEIVIRVLAKGTYSPGFQVWVYNQNQYEVLKGKEELDKFIAPDSKRTLYIPIEISPGTVGKITQGSGINNLFQWSRLSAFVSSNSREANLREVRE